MYKYMEIDYEFTKNIILVILPTVIGIIGSKVLVNSWQIRKEKFNLRKEILTNFEETYPLAQSSIYGFYYKLASEYADADKNAEYDEDGHIDAQWKYPTNEAEKPYKKFIDDFKSLNLLLSQINHKVHSFTGLIVLYFEDDEKISPVFESLRDDLHTLHLRIDRMVNAKSIEEIVTANKEFLEINPKVRKKIIELEELFVNTKLKNPKV